MRIAGFLQRDAWVHDLEAAKIQYAHEHAQFTQIQYTHVKPIIRRARSNWLWAVAVSLPLSLFFFKARFLPSDL
jgi:hypothetical protein